MARLTHGINPHGAQWRFKWDGSWRSFPTLEAAEKALEQLLESRGHLQARRLTGRTIESLGVGHLTVSELCEAWLAWKTSKDSDEPIRSRTQSDYRRCLNFYIAPLIGDRDAASIATADLKRDFFRVCSSRTFARFSRTVLQQAFRWGIEERVVARGDNPCVDVRLVRRGAADGRNRKGTSIRAVRDAEIPTPGEIQKMLGWSLETGRDAWWLWVYIDSTLGLRPSEVCALQVKDFDFARKIVSIERAAPDRSDPTDWHLKTETSRRQLKVGDDFFETIRGRLPESGWLFSARARGGGLPQRTHTATPCWPGDAPNREMRRMRRALGLSELYRPYSLRHFVATRLILQGKDEIQVARFLGTSVDMLQKVYANHLDHHAQRDIGEAVTNLF